jgi:hypothetical protein
MRKAFWLSLALVAVLVFSTSNVFARGGHGGGGHHGGGHHGGGHHAGHHSHTHSHTGHHDHHGIHHYHHSNWAHHNHPFSHGWYGRHGGTWGYGWGGWGWGNPWAISTFGATAAWLGLEAATPYYGNYGGVNNVLTSDSEPTEEPTAGEAGENETEDTVPTPTPEQVAAATELASSGKQDPPKNTSFLPLGVFSIAPQGQTEASALVQLAVSKDGLLRGTYYDLLTDHDQPIRGTVNKKTQQVAFTFGINGKVTFETSLANLTQEKGPLAAHFENGKTSTWTLARYEKEPTAEVAAEDTQGEDSATEGDSDDVANDEAPTAEPQKETAVQ